MFLSASKCQIKNGGFSVQCDFSVEIGNHLSLFGPSGSGKSSVLLGLAGFLPIINGDLIYDDKSISKIEEAVLKALESSPPELSADIYDNGIYLTGGGALLRGLDKRLNLKTKLPIHVAEEPLRAVVRGTGIALKNIDGFRAVLMS